MPVSSLKPIRLLLTSGLAVAAAWILMTGSPFASAQDRDPPAASTAAQHSGSLKVHESGKYLVTAQGKPFFYLGDTAWELFHRLTREEAAHYLDDRAAKGFTVIQAVALAEIDGLNTPNAYGHNPLIDNDPTKPDVRPGGRNDYWDHVDDIVQMAQDRGLYIGLLPTWGDKWVKRWGVGPEVFTPDNAEKYGEWIGRRYKDRPVIWILGGDRDPETEVQVETIRAMARGLAKGDGGTHLMTYHPQGTSNSAQIFHADDWLDFNMIQSGHARPVRPNYIDAQKNINRTPRKPTLDGEPCYEDHPVKGDTWEHRHDAGAVLPWFDEWDVRKAAYESLLAGSCGHTYGDHSIWQFWQPGRVPLSEARTPWQAALHHPGSQQMRYLKELFLARPYWKIHADQSLITSDNGPEENCARVAIADDGSFAIAYLPIGNVISLQLENFAGKELTAWWFNPRQNTVQKINRFAKTSQAPTFIPPHSGRNNDWVLIIDDSAAGLPHIGD